MSNQQDIQSAIQYFQAGNIKQSKQILNKYIVSYPDDVNANLLSAAISAEESDFSTVVKTCRRVLTIEPGNVRASYNAAVASEKLHQYQDVLEFTSQVLQIDSNNSAAILLHISALYIQGKYSDCISFISTLSETIVSMNQAISIKLAECYMNQFENEKAILIFRQCISSNVKPAECLHNIGIIEDRRNNIEEAIKAYRLSLSLAPHSLSTNYNLAFMLDKVGEKKQAINFINTCFEIQASAKVRQAYVQILSTANIEFIDKLTQKNIQTIVADDETDAQTLSSLVMEIIKHRYSVINNLFLKANESDYTGFVTLLKQSVVEISKCHLLKLFFINLPITDYATERFLKTLRRALLLQYSSDPLVSNGNNELCAAIAIRCYINGYVYTVTEDEKQVIDNLINHLNKEGALNRQGTSHLAMYVSLYDLHKNNGFNINTANYGETYGKLIKLQLDDNLVEDQLNKNLECVSEINNETSLIVQSQYESNPYPVWQTLSANQPEPIVRIIQAVTSYSDNIRIDFNSPEILIAGCGTGSHAIQSAMRIQHKTMTAVDLSRRSLAFAKRKSMEYGLEHIDFKQMDILQITRLGKTFDIIESVGVLHHMQNPLSGLQSLVAVLNPGGLMNLGFYSKLGRRHIINAKSIYDDPNSYVSDDEIRQLRIEMMDSEDKEMVSNISGFKDFYSLHDCRDLIFHENENNYSIAELANLMEEANLEFIGFDLYDASVLPLFRKMFPDRDAQSKIQNWEDFEEKYPDTFSSMYVFWCRKKRK